MTPARQTRITLTALVLALAGCAGAPAPTENAVEQRGAEQLYANWPDPFEGMPHGPEQTARVCERAIDDSVLAVFCGGEPAPTSLHELQARLNLSTDNLEHVQTETATHDIAHSLAVTGHSTGLSKRSVSAINPRLILQRSAVPTAPDAPPISRLLTLAFSRGEQFIELIATGYRDPRMRFYVIGYRQACNSEPAGCGPYDLLSEETERTWTEISLYEEKDLANTVLDCAPCHQPNGPGSRKLLRMQEIDVPWTHWFMTSSEGGRALWDDFIAAHPDETFGGMTSDQIQRSDPNSLSIMVSLSGAQPNAFASKQIEQEIKDSAAALGGAQPFDNSVPGTSATWLMAFERASRGEAIPVPYHNVKVTDPDKLAAMTSAYRSVLQGDLPGKRLPDIRDVFPDDAELSAQLGVATTPGLDGASVLIAACAQCHNENLDQNLSRARFRADLQGMDRAERELAIERMQLPPQHPLAMPPTRLRVLSDEARDRAIESLRQH